VLQFLKKKNEENRANMELVMSGPKEDVLTRLLRGLSGAKVTKQGKFSASDDSPFLSCTYRNDAGNGHMFQILVCALLGSCGCEDTALGI
jgi:hypothetical protein